MSVTGAELPTYAKWRVSALLNHSTDFCDIWLWHLHQWQVPSRWTPTEIPRALSRTAIYRFRSFRWRTNG